MSDFYWPGLAQGHAQSRPAWARLDRAGLGRAGPAPASGNLHFELLTSLGQPGLASAWPGQPSFQSFTGLGWPGLAQAGHAQSGPAQPAQAAFLHGRCSNCHCAISRLKGNLSAIFSNNSENPIVTFASTET